MGPAPCLAVCSPAAQVLLLKCFFTSTLTHPLMRSNSCSLTVLRNCYSREFLFTETRVGHCTPSSLILSHQRHSMRPTTDVPRHSQVRAGAERHPMDDQAVPWRQGVYAAGTLWPAQHRDRYAPPRRCHRACFCSCVCLRGCCPFGFDSAYMSAPLVPNYENPGEVASLSQSASVLPGHIAFTIGKAKEICTPCRGSAGQSSKTAIRTFRFSRICRGGRGTAAHPGEV